MFWNLQYPGLIIASIIWKLFCCVDYSVQLGQPVLLPASERPARENALTPTPESRAAWAMRSICADSPWHRAVRWRSHLGDDVSVKTFTNKNLSVCLPLPIHHDADSIWDSWSSQSWRHGKDGGSHGDTLLLLYDQQETRRSYPVRPEEGRLDGYLPDAPGCKHNSCPSGQRRRGLNTSLLCRGNKTVALLRC